MLQQLPLLIDKQYLATLFVFSVNIPDWLINQHIQDAQQFALAPVLPQALTGAVFAEAISNPKRWNRTTNYAIGDKVESAGKYYVAVANNSDSAPPSADWADAETMNFWAQYVKPFVAADAYWKYLLWAGVNVAPQGLRVGSEPTSQPLSDKQRGEIMKAAEQRKYFYQSAMIEALQAADWTLDGVVYGQNSCAKPKGGNKFGIITPYKGNKHGRYTY
jgi:hypothetical protein